MPLPTNVTSFGAVYEYKIVTASTPQVLESRVMVHMSSGWQLTGGFSVQESLAESWCQTMYRITAPSVELLQS